MLSLSAHVADEVRNAEQLGTFNRILLILDVEMPVVGKLKLEPRMKNKIFIKNFAKTT